MLPKARFSTFAIPNRARGEIGRHATLRGWFPYGCASSSLVLGTNKKALRISSEGFFIVVYFKDQSTLSCINGLWGRMVIPSP